MSGGDEEAVIDELLEFYPLDASVSEVSEETGLPPQRVRKTLERIEKDGKVYLSRSVAGVEMYRVNKLVMGLDLFNEGEYVESHDTLEEVWNLSEGEEKRFLRGLTNLGVAYAHYELGKLSAAKNVLEAVVELLEPFTPAYRGVRVRELMDDVEVSLETLEEIRQGADKGFTSPKVGYEPGEARVRS